MLRNTLLKGLLVTALAGVFAASANAAELKKLKVGVTAGVAAEVLEQVVPIAKQNGLDLKIVEFQDYVRPNAALNDGDIDTNVFQTKPFLERVNAERGYKLRIAAKVFTLPMAFYSHKIKRLEDLPQGASVGIPNDQAMGGRALLLLASSGLIELKDGVGLLPSVLDITKNPKKLKFVELEAAQLPRSLDDLTLSAVNGNYAYVAKLNPLKDGLITEPGDSPWVCHVVVNEKDLNQPWVQALVKSIQRPEIKQFIADKYKGNVLAGF
jgi:D-methionine transport system substrate-binding protein